jgi:Cytochrome c3
MPKPFIPLLVLAMCLSTATAAMASECKVCHSKNPKMVAMHTALRGEGCFGCHNAGDKLMGKGQPKDRESQLKRRGTDVQCVRCHRIKE